MAKFKEFLKFFILLQILALHISNVLAIETRIVGGSATTINNVPYIVQLRENGKFFCGGTLVSPRYVVTAAHCVKGMRPGQLTIVGGATKLSEPGVRSQVSKIMVPNGFSLNTMNLDVAVLKLSKDLTGAHIAPIDMCTNTWPAGATVKVSGWGKTNENSNSVVNQVRTVNVRTIAKTKCSRQFRRQKKLTNTMTCASIPGRKDSCLGDSGGPAIYNGKLCGVVSWGIGCARSAYPGVYTNIRTVRKFINAAMKK